MADRTQPTDGILTLLTLFHLAPMLISGSMGGNPYIVHESGWPLSGLFSRIGRRLTLVEEAPLRISGLPPGTYSVSLDRFAETAVVRADEETVVELLD